MNLQEPWREVFEGECFEVIEAGDFQLSAEQVKTLINACWDSEWNCYPDDLDERQINEALLGHPPAWKDYVGGKPVYASKKAG